jgi:hypothetical protein
MNKELFTVKELAAELRMSPKSIQRAYRKEEIPGQWLGRMARFDLVKVRRAMARNGRSRMRRLNGTSTPQGATAGQGRRRARKSPRSVRRGLSLQRAPGRDCYTSVCRTFRVPCARTLSKCRLPVAFRRVQPALRSNHA